MSNQSEHKSEFTFTWIINNFSLRHQWVDSEAFYSPVFTAESLGKSQWNLGLYQKRRCSFGLENDLHYFLNRRTDDDDGVVIALDFKIEIIDADGHLFVSKEHQNSQFKKGSCNGSFVAEDADTKNAYSTETLTIRCCMVRNESRKSAITKCIATTNIPVHRCSFKWHVQYPHLSTWSESRNFSLLHESQFEITLTAPEDEVKIIIHRNTKEITSTLRLGCRISLLNQEGTVCVSKRATHIFKCDEENWTFPSFIKKNMLKNGTRELLKKDTLTLHFVISVGAGLDSSEELEYIQADTDSHAQRSLRMDPVTVFQQDLRRMYTNHMQSDVELRAGGVTFPAHKSVLSARSQVFCAMFNQDMLENQTGIVDIPDTDANTLSAFLLFMYSGRVDNMDFTNASSLLTIANKYQVLSLKSKCSYFLMSVLNDGNAHEVLELADVFGPEYLKASAVNYIKKYNI